MGVSLSAAFAIAVALNLCGMLPMSAPAQAQNQLEARRHTLLNAMLANPGIVTLRMNALRAGGNQIGSPGEKVEAYG